MQTLDIVFLSFALAMDCFTVSIVSGVILHRYVWTVVLRMSVLFGLFQALMPFLGWLFTNRFSAYIESVDHWIAFGLLAFLGGKMIRESFDSGEDEHFSPDKLKTQLVLSVATSIDALAVGISFACVGYGTLSQLLFPLAVIGAVSFLMGIAGNALGVCFGRAIERRLRPELLGGIILVFIGFKILLSHLEVI